MFILTFVFNVGNAYSFQRKLSSKRITFFHPRFEKDGCLEASLKFYGKFMWSRWCLLGVLISEPSLLRFSFSILFLLTVYSRRLYLQISIKKNITDHQLSNFTNQKSCPKRRGESKKIKTSRNKTEKLNYNAKEVNRGKLNWTGKYFVRFSSILFSKRRGRLGGIIFFSFVFICRWPQTPQQSKFLDAMHGYTHV